ncbi:MAG: hypothetical protein IJ930_01815 [Lachnospiraceae bacterium]|nr:hypothetical protein [Lachnospiraceae bacterium]
MLTKEQRIRDYEYLWDVLHRCFPLKGAMERLGFDWDKIEKECRPGVENAADDLEFCIALDRVFEEFKHFAHTNLLNARMYENYKTFFRSIAEPGSEYSAPESVEPWIRCFGQPRSDAFYSMFDSTEGAGREFYWKGEAPEKPVTAAHEAPKKGEGPFAAAFMLPGETAYFKVPGIPMERIPIDRPVFFDFYAKYGSCENMVIDFRGNGGGATDYWKKLIVEPVIDEELVAEGKMGFDLNELNRDFLEASFSEDGEFASGVRRPAEELLELPAFHKEDLAQVTEYYHWFETYRPDREHHFTVRNRIWLLTDKRVYSSAEGFAKFCKENGFATLVGGTTGGDGGSMTPSHAILPESGLVIRYKCVENFNKDGSSNAECCTVPDIECDPALALAECLAVIAAERSA